MMMGTGEMFTQLGSVMAGIMFVWAMFQQYFPFHLRRHIKKYSDKVVGFVYPYIEITFQEFAADRWRRSEAYASITDYLGVISSTRAKRLKGDIVKDSRAVALSMGDHEEVTDEFQGVKLWWASHKTTPKSQTISFYPGEGDMRYYTLSFHKRHRDLVVGAYLDHVIKEGKEIAVRKRQRKLFTNNPSQNWGGYRRSVWSHVAFEHPATFQTLAMDEKRKEEIVRDLIVFRTRKAYYSKIGKAWKRGYLLHGPPGTGKSSMIAAMANLMDYDIYDVELTSVKDNTELRKLLIETTSKSIIVIEDIDCSLDLTGQREKEKKKEKEEEEEEEGGSSSPPIPKKGKEGGKDKESKVTLSGLLNFIDGLWSACGEERIIVFTTNHLDKLDPALIRRGRMDMHIELSYCRFDAFKVLAKNYLDLDSHPLFPTIGRLLEEADITPADVAETLIPKSMDDDAETACLESLIQALETAKEEARVKAEKEEEEKRVKAEKEEEEKRLKAAEKEGKGEKEENQETTGAVKEINGVVGPTVTENGVVSPKNQLPAST